jgi:hypothetical protein
MATKKKPTAKRGEPSLERLIAPYSPGVQKLTGALQKLVAAIVRDAEHEFGSSTPTA